MTLHRVFFYLTILLLPTQLGLHFWPDWALVIGRRLDYLSPTIYLTDITIFLTFFFWITTYKEKCHSDPAKGGRRIPMGSFASLRMTMQKSFPKLWKIENYIPLILAILYIACNIIFATSPIISFSKWIKVFEFVLFGFYIVKTKPSFSRSILCLSFAVFYSSIIAIAQFFLQHSVGGPLWFLGERTFDITTPGIARIQLLPISLSPYLPIHPSSVSELLRPYATFPHPNVLGGFLAVTLPLIIYKSANDKSTNKKIKIFRWTTIFLGFVALVFTFSRSAWVAGIIGLFILLFLHFRSIKNYLFIGLLARRSLSVGGVAFIGFVGLLCVLPYFQSLTPESESVFVRNELAIAAISLWKTSPLIGVGLGNFLIRLPQCYPHREIFFLQPVHNIYLLILSETGVIGSIFALCGFYYIYRQLKKGVKIKFPNKRFIFIPLISSLITLLLLGFVDHYPLTLQQGQLLFTLLISLSLIDYKNGWRG